MSSKKRYLHFIILLFFVHSGVRAQETDSTQAYEPKHLKVYLMTFGPGEMSWEKFGHNAIWISGPNSEEQIAYNYGLFEFVFPNFFIQFIKGNLRYSMEGWPTGPTLEQYVVEGRDVWVDQLNLNPDKALRLSQFLQWNALEPHKFYQYDYYQDNCSTRVRDALDSILGGQIRSQLSAKPTDTTYRFHTQRLMQSDVILYTAIDFILGVAIDRPINAWEEAFLPIRLRQHLLNTQLRDDNGHVVPFIAKSVQVAKTTLFVEEQTPPRWIFRYLLSGTGLGFSLVIFTIWVAKRKYLFGKFLLAFSFTLIYALLAAGGTLSAWAWGFSSHWAAYANENLFQAHPLLWPMVIFAPRAVFGRARPLAARYAWAMAGISAMGVIVKILPGFHQVNGQILMLLVPVHLGLATSLRILQKREIRSGNNRGTFAPAGSSAVGTSG